MTFIPAPAGELVSTSPCSYFKPAELFFYSSESDTAPEGSPNPFRKYFDHDLLACSDFFKGESGNSPRGSGSKLFSSIFFAGQFDSARQHQKSHFTDGIISVMGGNRSIHNTHIGTRHGDRKQQEGTG